MKVVVTGANGFIGKNLIAHLRLQSGLTLFEFTKESAWQELESAVAHADFIFHLAGVNRPVDMAEFAIGNANLTRQLCNLLAHTGRKVPLVFASSIQAESDNPYGVSKREAEQAIVEYQEKTGSPVAIYRLSNVFGKWCRPNYNSAVATFCNNIARDLPIRIDNPASLIRLIYIDDVIASFIANIENLPNGKPFYSVDPEYTITVGELVNQIRAFGKCRDSLVSERVGAGLIRALYATYISYLPEEKFVYEVPKYSDPRGVFVEMLKTQDSGQFSYFTAHPGITRGSHYHHSKTEKFLIIKGTAKFRFRHIVTGEMHEVITAGDKPEIVETIPGWAHDITNVGADEMIVMLWANEIYDRGRPDTYQCVV